MTDLRTQLCRQINDFEAKIDEDEFYFGRPEYLEGYTEFLDLLAKKFTLKRDYKGRWI